MNQTLSKICIQKSIQLWICVVLAACSALPRSGPSTQQVAHLAEQNATTITPEVMVLDVSTNIAQHLYQQKINQSFSLWQPNQAKHARVDVGDVLEITLWEAPPAVLLGSTLASAGGGSAQELRLPNQMVNTQGKITIPFAGSLLVKGKTLSEIQDLIAYRLRKMANQPQAIVRLAQNNAATVSVIRAGNSVRMPLTEAGERVLDAVAAVGGSTANVQDTNVQLTRGNVVRTIALEELVANPRQNIMLRKGDIITMITNPYTFTALGAVGHSQEIGFSARGLSLAEAVGRMGGLQDQRSDARGVFVFRYEKLADLPVANQGKWQSKGYSVESEIPVVYRVNMADANSFFWMQRFPVKNKDVVYVSNAPLAELQKFLQFVLSPATRSIYDVNRVINRY